jgi:hypothetical protein
MVAHESVRESGGSAKIPGWLVVGSGGCRDPALVIVPDFADRFCTALV